MCITFVEIINYLAFLSTMCTTPEHIATPAPSFAAREVLGNLANFSLEASCVRIPVIIFDLTAQLSTVDGPCPFLQDSLKSL